MQPNILLIITDDLCWGDLACHGNPHVRTPRLDQLHAQSTRFTRYCSGPLCTPARASLFTGRYPYRTGAIDTYLGRSIMDPREITLGEIFQEAGYATGLFGKWHLGDHYPTRACDKGFQQTLVHQGGGLRQPGSFTDRDGYMDPDLQHNGRIEPSNGYCTDVFTDAAMDFIAKATTPFLCCLAPNVPHVPLHVPQEWFAHHLERGLNEKHARLYAMIENLDMNLGRIFDQLGDMKIDQRTVVIFTSDHGPCPAARHEGQSRFNAELRGLKGSLYEGGIRTPCFWRWPDHFPAARDVAIPANPIDVLPTLANLCRVPLPSDRTIDGINLLPAMRPDQPQPPHERTIIMQWHRGDVPRLYTNCAVITSRWKLVDGRELYDLIADPLERQDVSDRHVEVVATLRDRYEQWFADVSNTRPDNYAPILIHVGDDHEPRVILTRQDWRGHGDDGWSDQHAGHWELLITRPGEYRIELHLPGISADGHAMVAIDGIGRSAPVQAGQTRIELAPITLKAGPGRLESWLLIAEQRLSPRRVVLELQPSVDLSAAGVPPGG